MENTIDTSNVFSEYSSHDGRAKALSKLLHGKFQFEQRAGLQAKDESLTFAPKVDPIGRPRIKIVDSPQPRSGVHNWLAQLVAGEWVLQTIVSSFIILQCFWTTLINDRQVAVCPPPPPPPPPSGGSVGTTHQGKGRVSREEGIGQAVREGSTNVNAKEG